MPFAYKAELGGLEDLKKQLDALKQGVRNKILRPAMAKATRLVLKEAKSQLKAVLRGSEGTGLLLKSLGSKVGMNRKGVVYGVVGPRTGFKKTRQGKVQTKLGAKFAAANVDPVRYAHLVEKGRRGLVPVKKKIMNYLGPGGAIVWARSVRPVAPRPFLKPALDRTNAAVIALLASEIGKGLAKVAQKA